MLSERSPGHEGLAGWVCWTMTVACVVAVPLGCRNLSAPELASGRPVLIQGRVIARDGLPLDLGRVVLNDREYVGSADPVEIQAELDESGRFLAALPRAGVYDILVDSRLEPAAEDRIFFGLELTGQPVELRYPEIDVHGEVVLPPALLAQGTPGYRVEAGILHPVTGRLQRLYPMRVHADGRFEGALESLAVSYLQLSWDVEADAATHWGWQTVVEIPPSLTQSRLHLVPELHPLELALTLGGQPAWEGGIWIHAEPLNGVGGQFGTRLQAGRSEELGLMWVLAGITRVDLAPREGARFVPERLYVQDPMDGPLSFELGSLHVRIDVREAAGESAVGRDVRVDGGAGSLYGETDDTGRYEFRANAGLLEIFVDRAACCSSVERLVALESDTTITVVMDP